jgi:SH3-like domain-containing protein
MARPAAVTADTAELGRLARSRARVAMVAAPAPRAATIADVAAATPLQIDGAVASWFRVRLPDGTAGYIPSRLVESIDRPVRRTAVATGTPLRDRPAPDAAVIAMAQGGALPVVGEFADYALVETGEGQTAWVPSSGRLK